jgi:CheY-like chemotaxis protein
MKKIMVLDDTVDTIELMQTVLELHGFEPITFTSPIKAMDYLRNNELPDLLILDMRMPEMSGIDFCNELKKNTKFSKLRVAFFTASSDLDPNLLRQNRVLGFIYKPFDVKELLKQINKYLEMNVEE